jgi:hypothetical protein
MKKIWAKDPALGMSRKKDFFGMKPDKRVWPRPRPHPN